MTDPMTSMEIEDVLSSIRRLVSEDLRPSAAPEPKAAPKMSAVAAMPAAPAPDTGKLLLTPALRVVASEPALPLSEPAIIPEAPFIAVSSFEEEGRGAIVTRIGAQVEDDWDAEIEGAPGGWPQSNFDPEVTEVDLEAVEEAEVVDVTSVEEARLEEAWRDGAWPDEPREELEDEPVPVVAPETLAAINALHKPVQAAQAIQTAQAIQGAQAEVQEALADLAEAAVLEALAADEAADAALTAAAATMADAVTAKAPDLFAPQDGEDFDEEALREVVRDIIREELQGALGERITRNVRKLVRAEINRALASRELS